MKKAILLVVIALFVYTQGYSETLTLEYKIKSIGVTVIPPTVKLSKCNFVKEADEDTGIIWLRFEADNSLNYLEIEEHIPIQMTAPKFGVLKKRPKQIIPLENDKEAIVYFANISSANWIHYTVTAKDIYNNIRVKYKIKLYTPDLTEIFTAKQWKKNYSEAKISVEYKNILRK